MSVIFPLPESTPYTKADVLKGLFMTEGQVDTILARLRGRKPSSSKGRLALERPLLLGDSRLP